MEENSIDCLMLSQGPSRLDINPKAVQPCKKNMKSWTPQEDAKLIRLYAEYPKKWKIIAGLIEKRNENQCLHRFLRLSRLGSKRKIWSAQEDQSILSLVEKFGKKWKLLSNVIKTKTGKQIRQRFINKLDPAISVQEWQEEEDQLILKYYLQLGSKWSEISKRLPGRPENKIKNRFYSFIQKNYELPDSAAGLRPQKQLSRASSEEPISICSPDSSALKGLKDTQESKANTPKPSEYEQPRPSDTLMDDIFSFNIDL